MNTSAWAKLGVILAASVVCWAGLLVPARAAAPFGETFDTYLPGNLYAQGLWSTYAHAWDVTRDGCLSGQCIVTTGTIGANQKVGVNTAAGEWSISFYQQSPPEPLFTTPGITFGSRERPTQSSLTLRRDTATTTRILDNNNTVLFSGLATGMWHRLTYLWDMSDPTNCQFSVRVDDFAATTTRPGNGSPADCYKNIYAERAIGGLRLSTGNGAGRGQVLFDSIGEGPVMEGCAANCDGPPPSPFEDSFDAFNDREWKPINTSGTFVVGTYEASSTGLCVSGGCVNMDGPFGKSGYMYRESGVGSTTGAFTLWAKVQAKWFPITGTVGICVAAWSLCDSWNVQWWDDVVPANTGWHQLYLGWRQGTTSVETCLMRDNTDAARCDWKQTPWPLGTKFDGIAIYGGGRKDLGDVFWIDELRDVGALSAPPPVPSCTVDCNDNVMFLPGIEASRLYGSGGGSERKLWEPANDADAMELAMQADGTSVRSDIYTRDILDTAYVPGFGNVYKSFIESMDGLVSDGKINEWKAVPYDWRYGIDQLLTSGKVIGADGSISYTAATSSPYIMQELKRLAASSRTGKVTIVAHSNGGLLAKALMIRLGPAASEYVDRLILVASPQVGTPEAIAALLHGANQGLPASVLPIKLSAPAARAMGDTMPGIYNLLPSANYFTYVDDPVVTNSAETMPDWYEKYGDVIHSEERLHAFLADTPNARSQPIAQDLAGPTELNETFLTQADDLHRELDTWAPPQGVKVIQIAGWGIPTTLKGISYKRVNRISEFGPVTELQTDAQFTMDGDGTVVVPSALWMSTSTGAENYWVDLERYDEDHPIASAAGHIPFSHARILEVGPLRTFISDLITNNSQPLTSYAYLSVNTPASDGIRIRYALHSPLTLNFYDNQGRHTGISTSTGLVEEQIPGTYYTELGDVKYIFTNTDTPLRIVMNGYATSTFTFNVEELQGTTVVASTTWQNMPVTPDTKVVLDTPGDLRTISALKIDTNGDGTNDLVLDPKLDGVVTPPEPPKPLKVTGINATATLGSAMPVFTATLSGFIDGDTASSSDVTGMPSCSTTATSTLVAGKYPIICTIGTLSSENYSFPTFVQGVLSVIYRFDGFLQPINNTGHQVGLSASVFKAGSAIPVKFQLKSIDGTRVQSGSAPLWLPPIRGAALTAKVNKTEVGSTTDSGTSYKWNDKSKQYVYNWRTKGLAPGYWYTIFAKLDDGTIYSVKIGLK